MRCHALQRITAALSVGLGARLSRAYPRLIIGTCCLWVLVPDDGFMYSRHGGMTTYTGLDIQLYVRVERGVPSALDRFQVFLRTRSWTRLYRQEKNAVNASGVRRERFRITTVVESSSAIIRPSFKLATSVTGRKTDGGLHDAMAFSSNTAPT